MDLKTLVEALKFKEPYANFHLVGTELTVNHVVLDRGFAVITPRPVDPVCAQVVDIRTELTELLERTGPVTTYVLLMIGHYADIIDVVVGENNAVTLKLSIYGREVKVNNAP